MFPLPLLIYRRTNDLLLLVQSKQMILSYWSQQNTKWSAAAIGLKQTNDSQLLVPLKHKMISAAIGPKQTNNSQLLVPTKNKMISAAIGPKQTNDSQLLVLTKHKMICSYWSNANKWLSAIGPKPKQLSAAIGPQQTNDSSYWSQQNTKWSVPIGPTQTNDYQLLVPNQNNYPLLLAHSKQMILAIGPNKTQNYLLLLVQIIQTMLSYWSHQNTKWSAAIGPYKTGV